MDKLSGLTLIESLENLLNDTEFPPDPKIKLVLEKRLKRLKEKNLGNCGLCGAILVPMDGGEGSFCSEGCLC